MRLKVSALYILLHFYLGFNSTKVRLKASERKTFACVPQSFNSTKVRLKATTADEVKVVMEFQFYKSAIKRRLNGSERNLKLVSILQKCD